jgi:hypothetical protein
VTIPTAINTGTQDLADPTQKWARFRAVQRQAEMALQSTKTALESGERSASVVMSAVLSTSDLLVSMLAVQEDAQCRLTAKREFNDEGYDVLTQWPAAVAAVRDFLEWVIANWPNTNGNIYMQRWDVTRGGDSALRKLSLNVVSFTPSQGNAVASKITAVLAQFV